MPPKPPEMTMSVWRNIRLHWHLYAGDPLPRVTDEIWTIPIVAYYHSLYTRAAASAIELLESRSAQPKPLRCCRRAIHIEPYQEGSV